MIPVHTCTAVVRNRHSDPSLSPRVFFLRQLFILSVYRKAKLAVRRNVLFASSLKRNYVKFRVDIHWAQSQLALLLPTLYVVP